MDRRENEKADTNDSGEKPPDEKRPGYPEASGRAASGVKDEGVGDTRTRRFPRDPARGDASVQSSQEESVPPAGEPESFSFRRKEKRSDYRPLLFILGIVLLIFFGLFIYQIFKSRQHQMVLKNVAETKSGPDNTAGFLESLENRAARSSEEEQARGVAFSDEIFQGEAPLPGQGRFVHFSPEKDAELAALADALNIRARVLFGIKTTRKEGIVTETCSGNFNNFRISSLLVSQAGQVLSDEISVTTPSRGVLQVTGKALESFSKTDPDQLKKDLESAGIEAIPIVSSEDGRVRVQLRVSVQPAAVFDGTYLIDGKGIGKIRLGADIIGLESTIAPGNSIIRRRIMLDNEFISIHKIEDQKRTPLYYVYEKNGMIWGIEIVDERFRTDRGLGIGSSLGAMRIYYTRLNMTSIPGKVSYLWIDQEELKPVKFILADDRRVDFDGGNFPLDIPINSILIGDSPYLN